MTEDEVQSGLIDAARVTGWRWYHTYNSKRSVAGFPDLTLVHGDRAQLAFVECKGDRGVISPEQKLWLGAFDEVTQRTGGVVASGIANPDTYDSWLTFLTRPA